MKKIVTHYDNLQVSHQASPSVIRAAFKALSQKWHPDKHQGATNAAARQKFQDIKQAYDVLYNPESRQQYDRWIKTLDTKKTASNKKSQQLLNFYTFEEKKARISVIV